MGLEFAQDDDDSDDGMDGQLSPGDDVMEIQYDSDEADRYGAQWLARVRAVTLSSL